MSHLALHFPNLSSKKHTWQRVWHEIRAMSEKQSWRSAMSEKANLAESALRQATRDPTVNRSGKELPIFGECVRWT